MSQPGDSIQKFQVHSMLMQYLAELLYVTPDSELIRRVVDDNIFEGVASYVDDPDISTAADKLAIWANERQGSVSEELVGQLMTDFTKLFVGTPTTLAPPWESVHFNKERMVFQRETMDVRESYAKYDLQVDRINHEPDDHISYELKFMGTLIERAIAAAEQEDDSYRSILQDTISFAEQHPLMWMEPWVKSIQDDAENEFYPYVAELALAIVKDLKSYAEIPV